MDYKSQVEKLLVDQHKCLCCVVGSLVLHKGKEDRVVALVDGKGEHGIFLYRIGQSATQSGELKLEKTIPVTADLKFNLVSQPTGPQTGGSVPVRLTTKDDNLLLELQQGDHVGLFLSELKRTIAIQSQTVGFGLPSSFSWIDKYTSVNPFLDDTFDPFKQSKISTEGLTWPLNQIIQGKNTRHSCPVVMAHKNEGDMGRSPSFQGFKDDFTDSWSSQGSYTRSSEQSKTMINSQSIDSLDKGESADIGKTDKMGGRENLIRLIMKSKQEEFTSTKTFRIFCGTWNVNGQAASEVCKPWLTADEEPPDIYAIGFQELDLSKNAYIFSDSVREEEWYRRVKQALHPKGKYKKLKLIRLVGMMLIVFVHENHLHSLYDVRAETVGTGLMGMLGNKGGVGVRFDLYNTSICFVNSHLAAHVEEYERRNQDYRDINSRMLFTAKTPGSSTGGYTISEHDMVFWIGDLNYRFSELDGDTCKKLIYQQEYDKLMGYDQLFRQISLKKVFLDYTEGRLDFKPTYRYDAGTDNWDTSEKCRTPAWCDRILWRGAGITQLAYRSHQQLKLSDHKPVSAIFDAGVKQVDQGKYRKVYEEVMKQLDRMENDFLPQVSLSATDVDFPEVKFVEPRAQNILVTNTGQVPVQYEFINKPNEDSYCKPWLFIKPNRAVINVGDSCDIQIEVYVDKTSAPLLNSGEDKIEDILVLHLEGGKDLFISVSGSYVPSCFGSSIEAMVNMYGPIRDIPTAQLVDLEQGAPSSPGPVSQDVERPLDIPKEIWRLVDHLYRLHLNQDIFQQPGLHSEIQEIRDGLDTGVPYNLPGSCHSVAEALLVFLEATAEPVIPHKFYTQCLDCCSNFTLCKQVLSQIPECHRNVFKYLCAFLRELLKHSDTNNTDPKFLATVFGGLFLRAPARKNRQSSMAVAGNRKTQTREEERKKAAFVYHFLTNDYDE